MVLHALGLIETIGYIPAIEAADIGAKTAEIKVHGLSRAGQGRVTVVFYGDISTVRAAIDAAETAAGRLGVVLSSTVIGRPADGLSELLEKRKPEIKNHTPQTDTTVVVGSPETYLRDDVDLEKLTVVKLREIARKIEGFPMNRPDIRSARKAKLIQLIAQFSGQWEK